MTAKDFSKMCVNALRDKDQRIAKAVFMIGPYKGWLTITEANSTWWLDLDGDVYAVEWGSKDGTFNWRGAPMPNTAAMKLRLYS